MTPRLHLAPVDLLAMGLTDIELEAIEALTEMPDAWPPSTRPSLPAVRIIIERVRAMRAIPMMDPDELRRRIGA